MLAGWGTTVSAADVDNFVISDYKIEMRLGRDAEQRSTMTTAETITADFPEYDQNHGLVRALPKGYDGHSTGVDVVSVTDENGTPRKYDVSSDDNDNLIVRMADMDVFVHGKQTYKLIYRQRDVTKAFANTQADELYWDTNGTEWRVPISQLSVKLILENGLEESLTGKSACYSGASGSTRSCQLTKDGTSFTTSASQLQRGENVTVAVGFQPGTFAPYQMTMTEKVLLWWGYAQAIITGLGAALMAWIGVRYNRLVNRGRELEPIVPEYLPPKYSVITSANIAKAGTVKGSVMAAEILDLAVRHYIKVYQMKEKKWYTSGEYEIEIIRNLADLTAEEKELLSDMYGKTPVVGDRLKLKSLQNNMAYFRRTTDDNKHLKELIRGDYKLREEIPTLKSWLRRAALLLLIAGVLTLSPVFGTLALITFVLSFVAWRLSDAGLSLRRYLEGLKMYIKTAEEERLKMLQSPEGAEKVQAVIKSEIGITEPRQLVKLYERVLPYAVLFGQEKDWSRQLGTYYEQTSTQPDWYVGHGAFNAVAFSSGMSGISRAASYASSSSSSSGGSSGGGSSGGGGGGGGGGGV